MRICNITRIALSAAVTAFAAGLPSSSPTIASPYQHYSLKLGSLFSPDTDARGLLVKARINGGSPLRMLLDSGAQHIILDKHAAAAIGAIASGAIELVGLGAFSGVAHPLAPTTVQIDNLVLEGCKTLAVDTSLIEGIDGIIPLTLFSGFHLRLDIPRRTLDLDPYGESRDAPDERDSAARLDHGLLFLSAKLMHNSHSGYVLLDTGATYNALSPAAAGHLVRSSVLDAAIPLRGGAGDAEGRMLPPGVQFQIGSHVFRADPAVMVDLSSLTNHHQFEISGLLGFAALRRSVLDVNYRDVIVRLDSK